MTFMACLARVLGMRARLLAEDLLDALPSGVLDFLDAPEIVIGSLPTHYFDVSFIDDFIIPIFSRGPNTRNTKIY